MQDINTAHTAQGQRAYTGPDRLRAVAAHLHAVGQGPSAMELEHFARELETVGVPTPEPPVAASNGHRPLPPADLERLLASVKRGSLADLLGDIPVRITIDLNPRD